VQGSGDPADRVLRELGVLEPLLLPQPGPVVLVPWGREHRSREHSLGVADGLVFVAEAEVGVGSAMKRKKILCLCAGGQVRSVTLGGICKYWFGHEAIAASLEKLEPDTLDMLYRWAEVIVVVEQQYLQLVPDEHAAKV